MSLENRSMLGIWGGHPTRAGGRGAPARCRAEGGGLKAPGTSSFGRRAARTSVPAASSCPFPASLPPIPGGSAEELAQPPQGGQGGRGGTVQTLSSTIRSPRSPRRCWRQWAGDRRGAELQPCPRQRGQAGDKAGAAVGMLRRGVSAVSPGNEGWGGTPAQRDRARAVSPLFRRSPPQG